MLYLKSGYYCAAVQFSQQHLRASGDFFFSFRLLGLTETERNLVTPCGIVFRIYTESIKSLSALRNVCVAFLLYRGCNQPKIIAALKFTSNI